MAPRLVPSASVRRVMGLKRIVFFAVLSMAAACGHSQDADDPAAQADPPSRPAPVAAPLPLPPPLPNLDMGALSEAEKRTFFEIVDAVNSPCGQPVSIARCVREGTDCRDCRHAAAYTVRLLSEGYPAERVRDLLRFRYTPDTAVTLSTESCAWKGAAMARVTIVEFADFECPHCREAHEMFDSVFEDAAISSVARLCYRFFPLTGHENARPAAQAAVAAANQGKFWQMHDLLYANQTRLSSAAYLDFANRIGLDRGRFLLDQDAEGTVARVDRDRAEGEAANIEGTPAIFVNGRRYEASPDASSVSAYIREELER